MSYQVKISSARYDLFAAPLEANINGTPYALVMLAWLKYAATIGDLSYLKISGQVLPPFQEVKRLSPFNPLESRKKKPTKKIGRNDPCICGSGKKYKRCCGSQGSGGT